ncbi:MAG: class I SAM-dependent methyltransferase [Acidimicrobiales bacterium]|nr:class I SAM-dependent methyltransferase [Acidimicrobiales bacterium]
MSSQDVNRTQFGANAANYATSEVHAKGASLARLVELVQPKSDWRALDIATAAGHTAFAFAPHVHSVVASDLTPEMIELAASRTTELDHGNVTTELADAENLPFDDASFDLVTSRIAPHHFPQPSRFVADVARVLRPGGCFGLVDNVVPDDPDAAAYYNAWEKRRDPSHARALGMAEWRSLIAASGFTVEHEEAIGKQMSFADWVNNMSVPADDRPSLLADLLDAPEDVLAFLRPTGSTEQDATFVLTEGIFVAELG